MNHPSFVSAAERRRQKGERGSRERFVRHWMWLYHRVRRILRPVDVLMLVVTHILFVYAEQILAAIGMRVWGKFPERIEPRGAALGTVVLAPGLQQTPFSAYPFGWFLSRAFRLRILFLQTPTNGNYDSFANMVERNRWIAEETGNDPLVGVGFSKGGQDLAWLFATLLMNQPKRKVALVMLSAPIRGSIMAKFVRTRGARALLPGTTEIKQTVALIEGLHQAGIPIKFFCGVFDRVVRRSDTRTHNAEFYRPPTWGERLRGVRRKRPWYWSQTIWFQFGHTAIYNPLAWFQVGWYVSHLIPRL